MTARTILVDGRPTVVELEDLPTWKLHSLRWEAATRSDQTEADLLAAVIIARYRPGQAER